MIEGEVAAQNLPWLLQSLTNLALVLLYNQSLKRLTLPASLQILTLTYYIEKGP